MAVQCSLLLHSLAVTVSTSTTRSLLHIHRDQWNDTNPNWIITESNFQIVTQPRCGGAVYSHGTPPQAGQGAATPASMVQLLRVVPTRLDESFVDPTSKLRVLCNDTCALRAAYDGIPSGGTRNRVVRSLEPFPCATNSPVQGSDAEFSTFYLRLHATGAAGNAFTATAASAAYFEVEITNQLSDGSLIDPETADWQVADWTNQMVSIGLVTKSMPHTGQQPGWLKGTFGYHGDDGHVFSGRGTGRAFGPRFGIGDTVGCGINYRSRTVFFTLNGDLLERQLPIDANRLGQEDLYPCVGVDICTVVEVNFGAKPFVFDLSEWESCEEWNESLFQQAIRDTHLRRKLSGVDSEGVANGQPMEGVASALHSLSQMMDQLLEQNQFEQLVAELQSVAVHLPQPTSMPTNVTTNEQPHNLYHLPETVVPDTVGDSTDYESAGDDFGSDLSSLASDEDEQQMVDAIEFMEDQLQGGSMGSGVN